jgi:transposase
LSEEELRKEAVRRWLVGESPADIAAMLGRTTRWVRKWVARHGEEGHHDGWAGGRSRAPHTSPSRTDDELRQHVLAALERLHSAATEGETTQNLLCAAQAAAVLIGLANNAAFGAWLLLRRPLRPTVRHRPGPL